MRSRIKSAMSRAKYAAIGAAIGAAVGGLFSRNAASTGGALGGLAGATLADVRSNPDGVFAEFRSGSDDVVSPRTRARRSNWPTNNRDAVPFFVSPSFRHRFGNAYTTGSNTHG